MFLHEGFFFFFLLHFTDEDDGAHLNTVIYCCVVEATEIHHVLSDFHVFEVRLSC